jgi:hypothetical protein
VSTRHSAGRGRCWWTRDADLGSRLGGIGEFRFPRYGNDAVTRAGVDELEAPRHVKWSIVGSFHPEWVDTTIAFDLQAEPDATVLRLGHRGSREPTTPCALLTTGWGYYVVSLQQYLETGPSGPSPDIDLARVISGRGG